jgi:hypothetical protein
MSCNIVVCIIRLHMHKMTNHLIEPYPAIFLTWNLDPDNLTHTPARSDTATKFKRKFVRLTWEHPGTALV